MVNKVVFGVGNFLLNHTRHGVGQKVVFGVGRLLLLNHGHVTRGSGDAHEARWWGMSRRVDLADLGPFLEI